MISTTRKVVAAGALVLAGVGGGAYLATAGVASAATGSSSSSADGAGHEGEKALTGTTADKVEAAALAKYPGAKIVRLETDSDGVYEAHITTTAGDDKIVQVGKDFAVTGTQNGGGDHDGDGPDANG